MQLRRNPTWTLVALTLAAIVVSSDTASAAPLARGIATYYGGRPTRVWAGEFTAAHRTLPFGSRVRVRDVVSGRSVVVMINDRGPFAQGRIIDLSHGAARDLGITQKGIIEVELELIQ